MSGPSDIAKAGLVAAITSRWRANAPGYLRAYWPLLLVAGVAAALDFVSTWRFMAAGDIEDELHPAIRLVSYWFGPLAGPLVGKLAQLATLVVVTVLFRRYATVLFLIVICTYTYAAWFNTWGYRIYTPVFAKYLVW